MFELNWLPALLGGFGSALLLIAEHRGLQRARLSRTNAYVAGLLALWAGYFVTMWSAGRNISILEIMVVTGIGGATVKALYWIDRQRGRGPKDESQLLENLKELERLKKRVEADEIEKRVMRNQINDFKALYVTLADLMELTDKLNTMLEHSSKLTGVGQAAIRLIERIKSKPGLPDKLRTLTLNQTKTRRKEQ